MYVCAELFCVLTNVSNKFVFRRFPLRGALVPPSPPACAHAQDFSNSCGCGAGADKKFQPAQDSSPH